jgi:hypothetical protein
MRTSPRRRRTLAPLLAGIALLLAGCGAGAPDTSAAERAGNVVSSVSVTPSRSAHTLTRDFVSGVRTAFLAATPGSPPRPFHPAGTLTTADNGRTAHFKVGETITLALKAADGFENWQVAPPDATVLRPTVDPAALALRDVTLRAFLTRGPGQTAITATSKPDCSTGQVCPRQGQVFKVLVIVGT